MSTWRVGGGIVPELPDVEGYRRTFHDHVLRKRIRDVEVPDPAVLRNVSEADARENLVGRSFTGDERRGKWLIARSQRRLVVFHFGMTGRLEWLDPNEDLGRFVRLSIVFRDGRLAYRDPRRLRGVWLCADEREVTETTGPLGPDAASISFEELDQLLGPHRASVKTVLMDQRVIAGIGNMLSDEVLWRAHVHPRSRYRDLPSKSRRGLHRALSSTVAASSRAGTIPRRQGWLSSQRGLPEPTCPRGHGPLQASKVAGRTSLWCPVCQGELSSAGGDRMYASSVPTNDEAGGQ